MIDIFNPEISQVVNGLKGKVITIFGQPKSGKTSNAVKAEKPVVLRFEQGLNAISGVRNFPMNKWSDFTSFVKALCKPENAEKAHAMYETIIVDTIDRMFALGEEYICNTYGIVSIDRDSSGKKGYGSWREYRNEVSKWINMLTNAGFTVIFIGHDDTKTLQTDKGVEYTKIIPRGDGHDDHENGQLLPFEAERVFDRDDKAAHRRNCKSDGISNGKQSLQKFSRRARLFPVRL